VPQFVYLLGQRHAAFFEASNSMERSERSLERRTSCGLRALMSSSFAAYHDGLLADPTSLLDGLEELQFQSCGTYGKVFSGRLCTRRGAQQAVHAASV
jgi:hypothetical protein